MKTLVFYDKMDNDGRGALAVLSKYINNVVAIGLNRALKDDNESYLDILEDELYDNDDISNVYFLDLAPRTKEEYEIVLRLCLSYDVSITIIDHHKLSYKINTYIDTVNKVQIKYIHETKYSACGLTYFYFTHVKKDINNLPYIVKLINDRDLFIRSFIESDYLFNTYSFMEQEELNDIILHTSNSRKVQTWLNVGKIKQVSKNRQKEEIKKLANVGELLNCNVVYINEEIESEFISEVGNELCLQYKNIVDFFINVKYDGKEDNYLYSLRSINGQALQFIRDYNFKGGGHDNACGFIHNINILDNIIPFDNK